MSLKRVRSAWSALGFTRAAVPDKSRGVCFFFLPETGSHSSLWRELYQLAGNMHKDEARWDVTAS